MTFLKSARLIWSIDLAWEAVEFNSSMVVSSVTRACQALCAIFLILSRDKVISISAALTLIAVLRMYRICLKCWGLMSLSAAQSCISRITDELGPWDFLMNIRKELCLNSQNVAGLFVIISGFGWGSTVRKVRDWRKKTTSLSSGWNPNSSRGRGRNSANSPQVPFGTGELFKNFCFCHWSILWSLVLWVPDWRTFFFQFFGIG